MGNKNNYSRWFKKAWQLKKICYKIIMNDFYNDEEYKIELDEEDLKEEEELKKE